MRISIIAAVAENGVIGRGGDLPWRLSNDLRRFKQLTMGHTVIMGRRTWESVGRALPGRRMCVVSRQPTYRVDCPEVEVAASLEDALQRTATRGEVEAFIIGGAELYKSALPLADRLYLTIVKANVEGDTFFPVQSFDDFDWNAWVILENETHNADSKNEHAYVFTTLQRCESNAKPNEA
jgi:dihydrofolate reductase